jgi:hypothetical protein
MLLSLLKYHDMKTDAEVEIKIHTFLTSAPDISDLLDSRSGRFTLEDRVWPSAVRDDERNKKVFPLLGIESQFPGISHRSLFITVT